LRVCLVACTIRATNPTVESFSEHLGAGIAPNAPEKPEGIGEIIDFQEIFHLVARSLILAIQPIPCGVFTHILRHIGE